MSTFLFNFKVQFAQDVESGRKLQTIRANRADRRRPVPGDIAKLYVHLRTSKAKLLQAATVTRCRSVRMDVQTREVIIDGALQPLAERIAFAKADGFPSFDAMLAWFAAQYGGAVFEGFCTEWTLSP